MSDTERQRLAEEFLRHYSDEASLDGISLQSPPPSPAPRRPAAPPKAPKGPGHVAPPSPPAPQTTDQRATLVDNVGQAVSVIATYIPSEALAAYIAITAILAPATLASRSTTIFLALALNIVFVLAGYAYGQQSNTTPVRMANSGRAKLRAVGVATWALLAYAAAMPDGFLTSFDWYRLQYGGVVALISAILLPLVAPVSPAAKVKLASS